MLTKQELADAYAKALRHKYHRDIGSDPGPIWAYDLGGGWVEVCGESLKPHSDLAHIYTQGWTLCGRLRYSEARKLVAKEGL